jgi:hypothetical protein
MTGQTALTLARFHRRSAGRFSPLGPVGTDLFPNTRKIVFGTGVHVINEERCTRPLLDELLVGCIRCDPLANNVLAVPTILVVRGIGRTSCSVENLRGNRHGQLFPYFPAKHYHGMQARCERLSIHEIFKLRHYPAPRFTGLSGPQQTRSRRHQRSTQARLQLRAPQPT